MLDHDNLEVYADTVQYDAQEASTDDGVAFYCALAQEAGGSVDSGLNGSTAIGMASP